MLVDLPVPGDNRGWFKENCQRQKLLALGLPDLGPIAHLLDVGAPFGVYNSPTAEKR